MQCQHGDWCVFHPPYQRGEATVDLAKFNRPAKPACDNCAQYLLTKHPDQYRASFLDESVYMSSFRDAARQVAAAKHVPLEAPASRPVPEITSGQPSAPAAGQPPAAPRSEIPRAAAPGQHSTPGQEGRTYGFRWWLGTTIASIITGIVILVTGHQGNYTADASDTASAWGVIFLVIPPGAVRRDRRDRQRGYGRGSAAPGMDLAVPAGAAGAYPEGREGSGLGRPGRRRSRVPRAREALKGTAGCPVAGKDGGF